MSGMYKIIGVDGQQYGPVNFDQVRGWIQQGRANAQTPTQADGSADWKPLRMFSEFAGDLNAPPFMPPGPAALQSRAAAKIPAGIFGILLGWLGIHKFILGYTGTGVTMLLVSIAVPFVTCGIGFAATWVMGLIGIIEGILYLTKSDEDFVRIYVDGRRNWF